MPLLVGKAVPGGLMIGIERAFCQTHNINLWNFLVVSCRFLLYTDVRTCATLSPVVLSAAACPGVPGLLCMPGSGKNPQPTIQADNLVKQKK